MPSGADPPSAPSPVPSEPPVWPRAVPRVGDSARLSRTDEVEGLEVREDKPITRLRTLVIRDDGTVAVEGEALCYTVSLEAGESRKGDP